MKLEPIKPAPPVTMIVIENVTPFLYDYSYAETQIVPIITKNPPIIFFKICSFKIIYERIIDQIYVIDANGRTNIFIDSSLSLSRKIAFCLLK